MNVTETPFDTTPDDAIAMLAAHGGPVLVDLDETLYLRNSTEDFIDLAVPGIVALMLMRLLDIIRPWRWSGGESTRDVWRVRAILIFFPWTKIRWRNRVAKLAEKFTNQPLMKALKSRDSLPVIVTIGFQQIVTPLIAAMGLANATIIAARSGTFADRRQGKLPLTTLALGTDQVRSAMLITDSKDDLPLLEVCSKPLRVVWPAANYRKALSGVYMPGQYISQVKRPGERYIFRGILQEDFAFWILSSIGLAAAPVLHTVALLLLLLSFWAIYEAGYVDNDRVAAKFEREPKLTAAFKLAPVSTPSVQPWLWSAFAGIAAIFVLRWPNEPLALDFIKWSTLLVATYLWFLLYNRFDKSTRVWMFSILQFARGTAFLVFVPVGDIGIAALGAHVLARWVPYQIYRVTGGNWPNSQSQLARLIFFVMLAMLLAISDGLAAIFNWTALALLTWIIFRARDDIADVIKSAKRLDRGDGV